MDASEWGAGVLRSENDAEELSVWRLIRDRRSTQLQHDQQNEIAASGSNVVNMLLDGL